jgi:hypothetical protein
LGNKSNLKQDKNKTSISDGETVSLNDTHNFFKLETYRDSFGCFITNEKTLLFGNGTQVQGLKTAFAEPGLHVMQIVNQRRVIDVRAFQQQMP